MYKLRYALAGLFLFYADLPAFSQTINFSGISSKTDITITVEEANIADVLLAIGKQYQFKIIGIEKLDSQKSFSTIFKGDLKSILLRLLRNNNHLIVSSSSNATGIKRIVILKERSGNKDNQTDDNDSFLPHFTKSPQQ